MLFPVSFVDLAIKKSRSLNVRASCRMRKCEREDENVCDAEEEMERKMMRRM